jgi:cytidine deaminase
MQSRVVHFGTTLAKNSPCISKHVAIVTRGRQILLAAVNVHQNDAVTIHAEESLLRKLSKKRLSPHYKVSLYVLRFKFYRDGSVKMANSKPCCDCCGLLRECASMKIKCIYYSMESGLIKVALHNLHNDYVTMGRCSSSSS